jgi:hypothetical protein
MNSLLAWMDESISFSMIKFSPDGSKLKIIRFHTKISPEFRWRYAKEQNQGCRNLKMKQSPLTILSNSLQRILSTKTSSHQTPYFRKTPAYSISMAYSPSRTLRSMPWAKTNVINRTQRPTASRGFTNGNRQPPPVNQAAKQINPAENNDYEPQCQTDNGRKRSSRDFTFR